MKENELTTGSAIFAIIKEGDRKGFNIFGLDGYLEEINLPDLSILIQLDFSLSQDTILYRCYKEIIDNKFYVYFFKYIYFGLDHAKRPAYYGACISFNIKDKIIYIKDILKSLNTAADYCLKAISVEDRENSEYRFSGDDFEIVDLFFRKPTKLLNTKRLLLWKSMSLEKSIDENLYHLYFFREALKIDYKDLYFSNNKTFNNDIISYRTMQILEKYFPTKEELILFPHKEEFALYGEINSLNNQIIELDNINNNKKKVIYSLKNNLSKKENMITVLKSKINKYDQKLTKLTSLENKISKYEKQFEEFSNENQKLNNQIKKLEKNIQLLNNTNDSLKDKLKENQDELNNLIDMKIRLSDTIIERDKKIKYIMNKNEKLYHKLSYFEASCINNQRGKTKQPKFSIFSIFLFLLAIIGFLFMLVGYGIVPSSLQKKEENLQKNNIDQSLLNSIEHFDQLTNSEKVNFQNQNR